MTTAHFDAFSNTISGCYFDDSCKGLCCGARPADCVIWGSESRAKGPFFLETPERGARRDRCYGCCAVILSTPVPGKMSQYQDTEEGGASRVLKGGSYHSSMR